MSGFEIRTPPFFYPDDAGGVRLRIKAPDGRDLYFQVTEAFALQCVVQGGLHLKKLEHARRCPERAGELMEPQR